MCPEAEAAFDMPDNLEEALKECVRNGAEARNITCPVNANTCAIAVLKEVHKNEDGDDEAEKFRNGYSCYFMYDSNLKNDYFMGAFYKLCDKDLCNKDNGTNWKNSCQRDGHFGFFSALIVFIIVLLLQ